MAFSMPRSFISDATADFALFTRLNGFGDQPGAHASGTDGNLAGTAADEYSRLLQVRQHLPLGPVIGMADIVADSPALAAHMTTCYGDNLLN